MNKTLVIWVLFSAILFSSCKVSKILNDGETLYKKSKLEFKNKKQIQDEKALESLILNKLYPSPNKKFLGLFYAKLWVYKNVEPKADREKGFKHWIKAKFAEPPVLIEDVNAGLMESIIDKTMQDKGYFNSVTSHQIIRKKQQAELVYTIQHEEAIRIDSIILPSDTSNLAYLIRTYPHLQTKQGQIYNLGDLQDDRIALTQVIRNYGYFDFGEQDLFFVVDTSLGGNWVDIHYKIKPPSQDIKHQQYYINDIKIYANHNMDDELFTNTETNVFSFRDYEFIEKFKFVGKRALQRNIIIQPGALFSIQDYNYTIERMNGLGVYNFVNINYTKTDNDSLDVRIQLTPGQYQSFRASVEASTSNRSFLGSSVSLNYSNRNLFKGAENLDIQASAGTEFQFVNSRAALNILNVDFRVGISLPRILFMLKTKKIKSGTPPRTSINIEENYQQWLQYYTINSFNINYRYNWYTRKEHHHQITPIFFNVLNLLNTTNEFDEILAGNPTLKTSFNNSVIFGRNYTYSLSTKQNQQDKRYLSFTGFAESAGNLTYGIARIFKRDQAQPYEILNIPFSQYIKFTAELKHYWKINQGSSLVSRINPGIGFAFGNSTVLPYVKQFYMGGPNTIRSFPFRSLGPGNYSSLDEGGVNAINPIEQAGDVKLLMNVEYRYTIYKFIKGAFFIDAGNVWLRQEDPNRLNSQFLWNKFYSQLALGTGIGIRLDFDFFAIRTDLGIPLHKPYGEPGERWIHQFPEQGFKDWRKKNWVWNIAIGYPF